MTENTQRDWFDIFWEAKIRLFVVFMVVITITYTILVVVDFIPELVYSNTTKEEAVEVHETIVEVESQEFDIEIENTEEAKVAIIEVINDPTPNAIVIDKLNKRIPVLNPDSGSVSALDKALLSGAVRHPDSADFERIGTIFMFGHSSYLPNVLNKNFQAFNGIQDLEWGDEIRLESEDKVYIYRVDKVYQVQASDAEVGIVTGEAKLTLATCNSFGSKDDRYIVESSLVEEIDL